MKKIIISNNLQKYWDKSVSELVDLDTDLDKSNLSEGKKERHRLYSLLLMSIIYYYWNGLKEGREGVYPLNPSDIDTQESPFMYGDYLGHNIAAIAVDYYGSIIDFDFNHNHIFSSSAEHAEIRVVKRVYGLSQINDSWVLGTNLDRKFFDFSNVSIYTSLESCAQCSGVMALASVKEVIYLQSDPGQYLIGNIMRNLADKAPLPISGDDIGFPYSRRLNDAYFDFYNQNPVVFTNSKKEKRTQSVTSFLCTEKAYRIYADAKNEFMQFVNMKKELTCPDYRPDDGQGIKTNADVVEEIWDFYNYATKNGKRGTAHH